MWRGQEPQRVLREVPQCFPRWVVPAELGSTSSYSLLWGHLVTHRRLCRRVMWLSPRVSAARVEPPSGRWLRLEERRPQKDLAYWAWVPDADLECSAMPSDLQDSHLHPHSVKKNPKTVQTKLHREIQRLFSL